MKELFWIGEVNEDCLNRIISEIAAVVTANAKEEIVLYITSGGGKPDTAFAFYDFIKAKKVNLTTIGLGKVDSAAVVILAAGNVRKATHNTGFLVHLPAIEIEGRLVETDSYVLAKDLKKTTAQIVHLLAKACGQPERFFKKLISKESFFYVQEAKEMGLIHEIV